MKEMKLLMVIWGGPDKLCSCRTEPNSMLKSKSYYTTPLSPPTHPCLFLCVCIVVVFVSDRGRRDPQLNHNARLHFTLLNLFVLFFLVSACSFQLFQVSFLFFFIILFYFIFIFNVLRLSFLIQYNVIYKIV